MKGSLRIMHFGFIIMVIVAVLIIGISRDATAQTQGVGCPCRFFESVPMTAGCWTFGTDDVEWLENNVKGLCEAAHVEQVSNKLNVIALQVIFPTETLPTRDRLCRTFIDTVTDCDAVSIIKTDITPEEVRACQCELLAYTTALNEGGIMVSGGPPYECGNVDCQVLTPIPTLNEYGMIITAGVLGLLAVIGLFVMRRRKVRA